MLEKNLLKITAMDFGSLYLTSSDIIQDGAFPFLSLNIMLLRTLANPSAISFIGSDKILVKCCFSFRNFFLYILLSLISARVDLVFIAFV